MTTQHVDEHQGNSKVFVSVNPSHSMPVMTDNEVFIPISIPICSETEYVVKLENID